MAPLRSLLALGLAALLAVALADEHDHDHDHAEEVSCGCAAADFDFKIDCVNIEPITAAVAALDGCTKAKCTFTAHDDHEHDEHTEEEDACIKNYLILQSHHDHCPPGVLSEAHKEAFHE